MTYDFKAPVFRSVAGRLEVDSAFLSRVGDVLALIREAGFEEVLLSVFPLSQAHPRNWSEWRDDSYWMNWNMIVGLRTELIHSKMPYVIDLLNEGIPRPGYQTFLQYDRRVWSDYTLRFGAADTVGISIIPEAPRLSLLPQIFGTVLPRALDLHFYRERGPAFETAHRALASTYLEQLPWIIGETYYNDESQARALASAAAATHQNIRFLLQWPERRGHICSDVDVLPLNFDYYAANGF